MTERGRTPQSARSCAVLPIYSRLGTGGLTKMVLEGENRRVIPLTGDSCMLMLAAIPSWA